MAKQNQKKKAGEFSKGANHGRNNAPKQAAPLDVGQQGQGFGKSPVIHGPQQDKNR